MLILKPDIQFELYDMNITQKDFAGLAIGWTLNNVSILLLIYLLFNYHFIFLLSSYPFSSVQYY